MNQDDIIKMAREAHASLLEEGKAGWLWHDQTTPAEIHAFCERFANLVAAAEREACAKVCDSFQERDVGMQPAECAGAIRRMK